MRPAATDPGWEQRMAERAAARPTVTETDSDIVWDPIWATASWGARVRHVR